MTLGIDASRYSHEQATGVEWYSYHIINALIEQILKANGRSAAKKISKIIFYSKDPIVFDKKIAELVKKHKNLISYKLICSRRLWTLWGLSRQMRKNPPDVLFVPSHVLPLSLPKKSVITIHDVAFRSLRESYSWFQYHYLDWSTKFAVKHATKIIVPSEATKKDLMEFYKCPKNKIIVINHGFSPPEITSEEIDKVFQKAEVFKYFNLTETSPYLFFTGRLEAKKNLIRVVEAFHKFLETYPDYRLVLAGKRGVGFEELYKKIRHLKLMDKVIMPGYVTEEEKAAFYKYCKFFVFPSLYEGFGLPVLEAFHYKKPVLASFVSSLPDVGGDAVYYADPYDVHAIYSGMDTLASNTSYTDGLIALGEERLKLFSWDVAAKKTLEIILK